MKPALTTIEKLDEPASSTVEIQNKGVLLGDKDIVKEFEERNIIIHPYNKNNLQSSSYDVSLGESFYREQKIEGKAVYNIYDEKDVLKVWGEPQTAKTLAEILKDDKNYSENEFENIPLDSKIIMIAPGETILCHTEEFIGGRYNITTMMKARSSYGRNFIEVCKCAGWGDVGYYNRFTMEITNNSLKYTIPLIVGQRIAQIIFFKVENVSLVYSGKYQKTDPLLGRFDYYDDSIIEKLKNMWSPDKMLPKLYLDLQ